jgi:hypothetical protein
MYVEKNIVHVISLQIITSETNFQYLVRFLFLAIIASKASGNFVIQTCTESREYSSCFLISSIFDPCTWFRTFALFAIRLLLTDFWGQYCTQWNSRFTTLHIPSLFIYSRITDFDRTQLWKAPSKCSLLQKKHTNLSVRFVREAQMLLLRSPSKALKIPHSFGSRGTLIGGVASFH